MGASEMHIDYYRQFETLKFNNALVYQKSSDHSVDHQPLPFALEEKFPKPARSAMPSYPPASPPAGPPPSPTFHWPARHHPPPAKLPLPAPIDSGLLEKGNQFLSKRQYDEAQVCFRSCLEIPGVQAAALLQLARLEADRKHLDDARRWLDQALELDPLQSQAHLILGMILHEQGDPQGAITHLRKTIYLEPDNILAHYHLANLYQQIDMAGYAARHRATAARLASNLEADALLPGTDNMTTADLLNGLNHLPNPGA